MNGGDFVDWENVAKFAMMKYRNGKSRMRLLNRIAEGWHLLCNGEIVDRGVAALLAVALLVSTVPLEGYAQNAEPPKGGGAPVARERGSQPVSHGRKGAAALPDSIGLSAPILDPAAVVEDEISTQGGRISVEPVDTIGVEIDREAIERQIEWADSVNAAADANGGMTAGEAMANDSIAALLAAAASVPPDEWEPREVEFTPDPTKAVWMSALFPGLGQVYNRRYWKLPIIVGGYLGLAYATNWNNSMLRDYTVAYADLLDNDPNTRSYMNMFSPNVKEENIDRGWLQNVLRSRKNYFRRNRDLCIICMVGVYLLAMVDAYVDASLSHFDISPDLSMDLSPAVMQDGRQRYPSVGLVWALNF